MASVAAMNRPGIEMNARQRKHVYMHSTIFDSDGPSPYSVYAPSRQHELYGRFSGSLGVVNRGQPPELGMPSAGDMKCSQNAGHNVVLPCEEGPAVKVGDKDNAIPKEFWSTSTTLQWHDTRNEQCRAKGAVNSQGLTAQEAKLQELSSEVFGTTRLMEASQNAREARHDLMADSADLLRMDSALHAKEQLNIPQGERRPNAEARARLQQNLADSAQNTMPVHERSGQAGQEPAHRDEPCQERRRAEKNFSDLFGAQMGERRDLRGKREEVTGTYVCSFLDTRGEIATRNKDHWRSDQLRSASLRKDAERNSNMLGFECPEKPTLEPQVQQILRAERSCWESKDGMQATMETARRRRMKDHLGDFNETDNRKHFNRKQDSLDSTQMRTGMGIEPEAREVREAWGSPGNNCRSPRITASLGWGGRSGAGPAEREALLRSPKDTKLASLQSSIFS